MGFKGRRRNLAWHNRPWRKVNTTSARNIIGFRTVPSTPMTSVPAGYRYVGHCRCGHGPNAYYQTPGGSIVHADQIFTGATLQPQSGPTVSVSSSDQEKLLKERLEHLQEEIAEVTNQLEELEGKKKRFPFKWRLR